MINMGYRIIAKFCEDVGFECHIHSFGALIWQRNSFLMRVRIVDTTLIADHLKTRTLFKADLCNPDSLSNFKEFLSRIEKALNGRNHEIHDCL